MLMLYRVSVQPSLQLARRKPCPFGNATIAATPSTRPSRPTPAHRVRKTASSWMLHVTSPNAEGRKADMSTPKSTRKVLNKRSSPLPLRGSGHPEPSLLLISEEPLRLSEVRDVHRYKSSFYLIFSLFAGLRDTSVFIVQNSVQNSVQNLFKTCLKLFKKCSKLGMCRRS